MDRVHCLRAALDGCAAGDSQHADDLDGASLGFRRSCGCASKDCSRCLLGIEHVGLAAPTAGLTVRSVHLDDSDALGLEGSGNRYAEASGAFDADGAYLSVSDEPDGELGVSGRGRRKLLGCDQHAVGADHCRVMSVLVGVDATDDDWTCHCDLLLVFGS